MRQPLQHCPPVREGYVASDEGCVVQSILPDL